MTDNTELKQLAEAATQGDWQVIETELPCRIGRPHVERRIFTAKDHPQLKAPYPVINGSVALGTDQTPVHHMVSMTAEDAAYIAAANPAAVLALIAERDQLKSENEIFEDGMRSLASTLGAGGYNAATLTATQLVEKVQWGVDHLAETSGHLTDQLRAEVAGLKTGYEAYERVNAELKAENEALRDDANKWQIVERAMTQLQSDEQGAAIWSACSRILISVASELNSGRSVVTEEGVTNGGVEIGDWRVTVERIDAALGKGGHS